MQNRKLTQADETEVMNLLAYECYGSWWTGLIFWKWGMALCSKYLLWKTKRKYVRYKLCKEFKEKTITPQA